MAIQQLQISGFRSFKYATWKPGRLNLLVGPNGGGKSNLLRLLELISKSARGDLDKTITGSGGIVPLLWDHRPGKLCWKLRIDPVDEHRDRERDALTSELELSQVKQGSAYEITRDTLGNWYEYDQGLQASPYWLFSRDARKAMLFDQQEGQLVPLQPESSEELDGYDENESLLSQVADLRNRVPARVRRVIGGWKIHHDIHVEQGSSMRSPATTQYASRMEPDGRNLTAVLHTAYTGNRKFKQLIDEGMRAGFGEEYEQLVFQPAAAQQIQLAIQWKSSSQPHAGEDLSDGTLRFLFLLAVLANPDPPGLIAIDEPEVGLHPSMTPIIAEYATSAAEHTQVILTSHSPEFLDAFSDSEPHVTLCHWEEGETHLFTLDAASLSRWLEQYRLGHLFTRGDLDVLTLPPVEQVNDLAERLEELGSEDDAMADLGKEIDE
ncbi:MAG: AAA family ATPase [Pirellulaceae bacterium]